MSSLSPLVPGRSLTRTCQLASARIAAGTGKELGDRRRRRLARKMPADIGATACGEPFPDLLVAVSADYRLRKRFRIVADQDVASGRKVHAFDRRRRRD